MHGTEKNSRYLSAALVQSARLSTQNHVVAGLYIIMGPIYYLQCLQVSEYLTCYSLKLFVT